MLSTHTTTSGDIMSNAKLSIRSIVNGHEPAVIIDHGMNSIEANAIIESTKDGTEIKSWIALSKIIGIKAVNRLKKQYTMKGVKTTTAQEPQEPAESTKEKTMTETTDKTEKAQETTAKAPKRKVYRVQHQGYTIPTPIEVIWGDEVPHPFVLSALNEGIDTNARPGWFPQEKWDNLIIRMNDDKVRDFIRNKQAAAHQAEVNAFRAKLESDKAKKHYEAAKALQKTAQDMGFQFDRRLVILAFITGMDEKHIMNKKWDAVYVKYDGTHITTRVHVRTYKQQRNLWRKFNLKIVKRTRSLGFNVTLDEDGWITIR